MGEGKKVYLPRRNLKMIWGSLLVGVFFVCLFFRLTLCIDCSSGITCKACLSWYRSIQVLPVQRECAKVRVLLAYKDQPPQTCPLLHYCNIQSCSCYAIWYKSQHSTAEEPCYVCKYVEKLFKEKQFKKKKKKQLSYLLTLTNG